MKIDTSYQEYQLYQVCNPQNDALVEDMCNTIQNNNNINADVNGEKRWFNMQPMHTNLDSKDSEVQTSQHLIKSIFSQYQKQ